MRNDQLMIDTPPATLPGQRQNISTFILKINARKPDPHRRIAQDLNVYPQQLPSSSNSDDSTL